MPSARPTLARILAVLMIVSLMLSLVPYSLMAQGPVSRGEMVPVDRATARPLPELLPQEVLDFFGDGLTADEFVARTGYVPRALDGLVDRDVLVIIQLEQQPAALVYAEAMASGEVMAQGSLDGYRRGLEVAQTQVMAQASALGAREISRYDTVYNGIQVSVPANQLDALRALPGVVSVRRAPIHTPSLAEPASLASIAERVADLGYTGDGLVIGIIDTGIDYTHAAFGGSGDPADYAGNDPDVREPGSFPTWKVIGGYDFAGSSYDASGRVASPVPTPDNDPLDEYGHGTHVAAIAAGFPVTPTLQPGVAPAAGLIAYKVFGKGGSTSLTMDALEMATENYLVFGYPDVINMSLGSPFGAADPLDPDVAATDAASAAGIVVVASAGNEGNVSYITGSPGVASTAISVAATTSGYVTGPTVSVPESVDPNLADIVYQPPAFSASGQYQTTITGTLSVYAAPGTPAALFCNQTVSLPAPPPVGSLAGKIALIERGVCTYTEKFANAAAAGAIAGLVYNSAAGGNERVTMGGDSTIPGGFLARQDGLDLVPFNGHVVEVSAVSEVISIPDPYVPAGQLASFSSRGPRGYDSFLKPEVAAPGVGIYAAKMASGAGGVSMSGTSMAAPYVAGVAALVREAHPDWTPEMVKAAIMNTAVDLADDTVIPLAGSGRVDTYAATTTEFLAIAEPDLVSLSWGVEYSSAMTATVSGRVTLYNESSSSIDLHVVFEWQDGSENEGVIDVDVSPWPVHVPEGGQATVDVAMTFDLTLVPMGYNALEEYFGYLTFLPTMGIGAESAEAANGISLIARVPFYGQVKPYAVLYVTGDEEIIHPIFDYATLEVSASGPFTSSLWAYPALVATGAPNPTVAPNASVRMFGMDYGGASPAGDIISVAIDTWAPWHVPQPYFSEFDLYLDVNSDGVYDYADFNWNYGWLLTAGADDNNTWVVLRVDLARGVVSLASPYLIYTDYNNSLMEWHLSATWHGLAPGNSAFTYQLLGYDQYGTPDVLPPGRFDYLASPYLWLYGPTLEPGPAVPLTYFGVWAGDLAGYRLAKPVGLMIVDYAGNPNNDDGAQAYLAPISLFYKQLYWFPFMVQGALVP
ncbi:MAG: S8 family serine peptidase [Anaerolineae bacterium]